MNEVKGYYANPHKNIELWFQGPLGDQPSLKTPFLSLGTFDLKENLPYLTHLGTEKKLIKEQPLLMELDKKFEQEEEKRFKTSVEKALIDIDNNKYEKIVLSRRKRLIVKKGDPLSLELWKKQFCHPQQYGHQFIWREGHELFISLSPESLFEVFEGTLIVDAIAGTTEVAETPEETAHFFEKLISDPKEQREHRSVCQDIEEIMNELYEDGHWEFESRPLVLKHLQHIHSRYRHEVDSFDLDHLNQLIEKLHPTPAVGGRPREAVLKRLRELEGYNRRHYAAPFIVNTGNQIIVGVGLRCCHVVNNEMTIYAGAGIVKGSTPEKEWLETERKCRQFL